MTTNPNLDVINNENAATSFANVNNNSEFHSFFSAQDSSSHNLTARGSSPSSSSSDVYSEAEDDIVEEESSGDENYVDSDEERRRINYYRRAAKQAAAAAKQSSVTSQESSSTSSKRGRKPRAPGEPPRPRGPPRGPRGPYKPRKPKDPSLLGINYNPVVPQAIPYTTRMHPALADLPPQAILVPIPGHNGIPVMVPYLPASMIMPHLAAQQVSSVPSSVAEPAPLGNRLPKFSIPIITTPSGMMVSSSTGQLLSTVKQEEQKQGIKPPKSPRLGDISVDDHSPSLVKDRVRRSNVKSVDYSSFDRIKEEEEEVEVKEVEEEKEKHEEQQSNHVSASPEHEETEGNDEDEDEDEGSDAPFVEKILSLSVNGSILSVEEALAYNDTHVLITPGTEHAVDGLRLLSVNKELPKVLEKLKHCDSNPKEKIKGVLLFLVKISNRSYWHVEWVTKDLILAERGGNIRYHRSIGKISSFPTAAPFFEEKYLEIDKILDMFVEHKDEDETKEDEHPIPIPSFMEGRRSFLIKWKLLPSDSATWEYESTIRERCPEKASILIDKFIDSLKPSDLKIATSKTLIEARNNNTPIPRPAYRPLSDEECESLWGVNRSLRPYQREGVDWLCFCWTQRQPCIIADEMGLGKTVQATAFLARLVSKGFGAVPGPFLIVAPLSCVPHWERELQTWAPQLSLLLYQGKAGEREALYEYEFWYRDTDEQKTPLNLPGITKFDVLLTSYEMAMAGQSHLTRVPFRIAIFDEAHRLKNKSSRMAEILNSFRIEHKILLTGTPLQNSIEELFALLSFIQPWRFGNEAAFLAEYGRMERPEDVAKIQALLRPLMLRRLKEDVEASIPLREETIIEVELTPIQKRYYRAILERNLTYLAGSGGGSAGLSSLVNAMMELRKVCMHPFLIDGAEDALTASATDYDYVLTHVSSKFLLVDKLLKKLRMERRRVLIFSQMTRMLDLLEHLMEVRDYPCERIDGRVRGELRQAAIDRFCNTEDDAFVFLLCTRAGGQGINLTAADTVIIYDSDWNPQNDLQAMARCHRIGQTRQVKVYRLVCASTYEQEMLERAGRKLGLDRAILQRMPGTTSPGAKVESGFSRREIETLLRKGAYGAIMDEEATPLEDEDIDVILERRTRVVTHQEEGDKGSEYSSSIFSKATFAASNKSGNFGVSEDDPNFWMLWARHVRGDEPGRPDGLQPLEEDDRRLRRQLKRLHSTDLVHKAAFINESQESEGRMILRALLQLGLGRSKHIGMKIEEQVTVPFVLAVTRTLFEEHLLKASEMDDKYLVSDSASLLLLIREEEENVTIDEETRLAAGKEAKELIDTEGGPCAPLFKTLLLRASMMRFLGRVIDRLFHDAAPKRKHLPGSQWLDDDPTAAFGFLGVPAAALRSTTRPSTRSSSSSKATKNTKVEKEAFGAISAALSALDWPPRNEGREGLPEWWSSPLHDISLLLSVWVHGLEQPADILLNDRRIFVNIEDTAENIQDAALLYRRLCSIVAHVIGKIETQSVATSSFDISLPETTRGKRGATRKAAVSDESNSMDEDLYPAVNDEDGEGEEELYNDDEEDQVQPGHQKKQKRERQQPARASSPRIRLRVPNKTSSSK